MKKLFLFILFIVQVAFVSAVDNEVSMVSYEQNWIDDQGTIALKNNTDNEVMSVSFMITYLDMNGNQLDYKEFKIFIVFAEFSLRLRWKCQSD